MPDHAHLTTISTDPEGWNRWRAKNLSVRVDLSSTELPIGRITPDLRNCNLMGTTISGDQVNSLDISGSDATGVTFAVASLRGLKMSENTRLDEAIFSDASLEAFSFTTTHLKDMQLLRTRQNNVTYNSPLQGVQLNDSRLENCVFTDRRMTDCDLQSLHCNSCEFEGLEVEANDPDRSLQGSQFQRCRFRDADFGKINMKQAFFAHCDLRNVRNVVFDNTYLIDNALSQQTGDRWSTLARTYTGPKMAFNLMFVTIFFLPWIVQVMSLNVLNQVQAELAQTALELRELSTELPGDNFSERYQEVLSRFIEPELERCLAATGPQPPVPDECRRIGSVVLGLHKLNSVQDWLVMGAGILLLFYNFARGVLTFFIAPLRDEQVRTGHTPSYRLPENWSVPDLFVHYYWMSQLHRLFSPLFWLSIVVGLVTMGPRLWSWVWVGSFQNV